MEKCGNERIAVCLHIRELRCCCKEMGEIGIAGSPFLSFVHFLCKGKSLLHPRDVGCRQVAYVRKELFPLHSRYSIHTMHRAPLIMGILNVTPDSFYDGGQFEG